ncbi:hypothetical protein [Streptomyces sp. NPDC102462]|uniref:hypothetical protein n=1 Tax=Streptomyces sp. NPDC102462 TaxID=3366178 RepID=UPI0038155FE0
MQDGDAIPAEEAGEWLRKNLKDADSITLMPAKPNPAVYREVMEILFGPRAD